MAAEEVAAEEVEPLAPAPAPSPAVAAPEAAAPSHAFVVDISGAQVDEVWRAPSAADGISLLARCMGLPEDYTDELRSEIWVEMVYQLLDFCRKSQLSAPKALAFLGVMTALHAHAVGERQHSPAPILFVSHRRPRLPSQRRNAGNARRLPTSPTASLRPRRPCRWRSATLSRRCNC